MGRNHARVYSELEEAKLAAVVDTNLDVAEKVAARFQASAYRDYRELFEKENLDAISIAVPTALHTEIALAAFEAGVNVLVEKPITATLEDGQWIIQSARSMGCQLMVGHIVRFNPAIQALKARMNAGELGRIFQIACRRVGPFPSRIRDVGVVVDLATHDLDLMRFLTGSDPARLFAETERRIHTDHEDLLLGLLHFPGGVTGILDINWLTPTKVREIRVLGERGMFRVDDLTQDLYFYENADANGNLWPDLQTLKGVSEGSAIRYALQRYEPLKAELQAFVRAVQDRTPMPVSGEDGLLSLQLALCLVESGQSHRVIEIQNVLA